ncbi:MAG: ABC transporter ATP-binding protein [Bacteriovoracia bacterium]
MIRIRNVKKQFDKRGIAGLNDLSFSIDRGEVVAMMGPNGSGKTTLLKMLQGSLTPDSGEIVTEKEVSLFPSTADVQDKNVQKFLVDSSTLEIDDEKKIQLARDLADTFEFTFQLRQKLSELSAGQKQKVLLAAELINRPSLLLMDEPFTHLDPFSRGEILNSLFRYIRDQEVTVLWVTHDLEEAFKYSDRIGLLNFGKLEQLDHGEALVNAPRNLFVAQFIGYRNFFSVKYSQGKWISPWGDLPYPEPQKEDVLMVIPDMSWEISDKGKTFEIKQRHAGKQTIEYICEEGPSKIFVRMNSRQTLLPVGSRISLLPRYEECFLIPL